MLLTSFLPRALLSNRSYTIRTTCPADIACDELSSPTSLIMKMPPTELSTGQSGGGIFSVESLLPSLGLGGGGGREDGLMVPEEIR